MLRRLIQSLRDLLIELWYGMRRGVQRGLPLYQGEDIVTSHHLPISKEYRMESTEDLQSKASKVLLKGRIIPLYHSYREKGG